MLASILFACIKLLDSNIKPIVFEKGKRIKDRLKDVDNFINNGQQIMK